jgi:hypothetical protein
MFKDALVQIFGDAGIEGIVTAANDIDNPWGSGPFCLKATHQWRSRAVLPETDIAGVDMDKVGLRIKTDSAPLKSKGNLVQAAGIERRKPDINGHAHHMQAVACDTVAAVLEHGVGLRRSVSGNNLKKMFAASGLTNVMEEIQQGNIYGMNISGSEILEEMIDFVQGFGNIATIPEIHEGKFLEGMGVIK